MQSLRRDHARRPIYWGSPSQWVFLRTHTFVRSKYTLDVAVEKTPRVKAQRAFFIIAPARVSVFEVERSHGGTGVDCLDDRSKSVCVEYG